VHLKSLRLQGFKTFARRTELPFSRGITAIVGPNGSGKSNLVDAIRWALGERNARGLRGHRMEDVIYSGGPGKSAVGMAEVTLTIDNADRRLDVDFAEIEVARRLFRSGESEYLINGARARLKDLDAMLASTGLRQDGYAVTAQNDIDFVIQAAPSVRRELIEEAAGVRRLRDQREEALNRLAEAERDMGRARDILSELIPRAEELRGQAAAAQEYQKMADALRALQGSLVRDAWRKAMTQLRRALARQRAADEKRAAAAGAIADFEPVYAAHRAAQMSAHEARWHHQELVVELRLRLSDSEHQARLADERRSAALQALAAAQLELDRLQASEQAGGRVVDELDRAVASAAAELEHAEEACRAAAKVEANAREQQTALDGDRTAQQQRRQELNRERSAVEADVRQHEGRVQFLNEQQQQARAQLDAWTARHAAAVLDVESRRRAVEVAERELTEAITDATDLEAKIVAMQAAVRKAERVVADHDARIRTLDADLNALRMLRDRAQRQANSSEAGQWSRLLELIEVDVQHRAAVEAALEGWMHAIVPDDVAGYEAAMSKLSRSTETRDTLLAPIVEAVSPELPAGLNPLAQVIKAPARISSLLSFLLRDAVLAHHGAEARRITQRHPELRAVTPEGEVFTAVSYRGGRGGEAALEIQAKLREGTEEVEAARTSLAATQLELGRAAAAHAALVDERSVAAARVSAVRAAAARAAGAHTAAVDGAEREEQQLQQLRQQLERIAVLLEQAQHAQAGSNERQRALVDDDANLTAASARQEESIKASAVAAASATQARQATELRLALARQRADDLGRQLERATSAWRVSNDALTKRRSASDELAELPARIDEERARWTLDADRVRAELATLESAEPPGAESLTSLEEEVRGDEQRNVALQVDLAHADDAVSAASVECAAAQAEVDRCAQALRDDGHEVELDSVPVEEVDWQKTEREVSRLQRRLDAMGAVNLLAPEAYAQVQERCESLGSQLADLESAAAHLSTLRQRLESEIDARFRTVFQSVAINFQEFFAELFEGGRATLRLEAEPEGNPLDEGVEILAQTPGKRLQTLTLLSGGERALTALAFLFALQAVNPSPFYVLDEVDAALDDANVVRFNRVLTRLARDQQFLIVTHNHSTMAQAEVLYGVTLGEHGISRMVSVRLQQDTLMPVGQRTA
jgi:chromosome segregation protein